MSKHTPPPRHPNRNKHHGLPKGRAGLVAYELARELFKLVKTIRVPRGFGFARDHLVRAAGNTVFRLSEACGRTMGNRYQHLEGAYAENQEAQSGLGMVSDLGVEIPDEWYHLASRIGGLIYGLLRAEDRARGE
jgi:hypothetical protein